MRTLILWMLLHLFLTAGYSQVVDYADRKVNLDVRNRTLREVFTLLSDQTSVGFSYSGYNDQRLVSIYCTQKTLREVLDMLFFGEPCTWQMKGRFVILKCYQSATAKNHVLLMGYVFRASDSSRINLASVYRADSRQSTLTNEQGFFAMEFTSSETEFILHFARHGFFDTLVRVPAGQKDPLRIPMRSQPISLPEIEHKPVASTPTDTTKRLDASTDDDRLVGFRKRFRSLDHNFRNIRDTFFTRFSFSLIPRFSTNRLLSVNTVNYFSVNFLSGYSRGLRGLEMGLISNIVDGPAAYVQIAGVGNLVTGHFSGFQMAGIYNLNYKRTDGFQLSGVMNLTRKLNGMQATGIFNRSDSVNGMQLSGVLNDARYVNGVQMASVLNRAHKVKGAQIGFINLSDSCIGAPIGFFSFCRYGYHKIGIEADELLSTSLVFGSGSDHFRNIYLIGTTTGSERLWFYGLGIGSTVRLSGKWYLDLAATTRQIQSADKPGPSLNLLNRFSVGVEYAPFKGISLGLAPTFNVHVSDIHGDQFELVRSHLPGSYFYNQTNGDHNVKMWPGLQMAIRFF